MRLQVGQGTSTMNATLVTICAQQKTCQDRSYKGNATGRTDARSLAK